jgi:hypothetical protein
METWEHRFKLKWPAHCVWESRISVDRGLEYGNHAALLDAEGDIVALIPDRVALVNPDRRLPELLADLLNQIH